ncbi:hypothetical protein [uncultured Algoriphagus sp.]|uniref:hypothetical protein n=1 Tax=uncultured Algoriphagus sp. TaxID=417365 RepID=UPI0030EB388B|tara:strand:- start:2240 stop:4408 length:2169 start_codon:yes stop_codon:yes gene_type:complete
MSKIEHYIAKIERELYVQAALKSLLVGISVGVFSLIFFSSPFISIAKAILGFFVSGYFIGLFEEKRTRAIQLLHERFSDLEFSLQLLGKPSKNIAEQLQWERVNAKFQGGDIQLWYKKIWPFFIGVLLSGGVYGLTVFTVTDDNRTEAITQKDGKTFEIEKAELPVRMNDTKVIITPPAYTGIPQTSQSELDVKAIIGSEIEWVISFENDQDIRVELINTNGDGLELTKENDEFILRDRVKSSGIYAFRASKDGETVYESDFYPLEGIEDLSPVILPNSKELYTYHFSKDAKIMNVGAQISDDFKVAEAYLVATLARGSGENVKFRENRIPLGKSNFKSEKLFAKLDLEALDFKPGDELYYYWAAMDNRTPTPNFSRSDTYFINYVDSTGVEEQDIIGMAIHVMPEYFRSQRQIIIDTENLIASKKSKSEKEFNSASNVIGSDQKLLRMRYGQYLGEENSEPQDGSEPVDFLAGHDHDHDHGAEMMGGIEKPKKKKVENHVADSLKNTGEDGLGGLMNAFLNNTQQTVQAESDEISSMHLLKLSLDQMWESELHLRLFEPEKALPFQYKALEYLKSVQQKSRAYVKRSGFDPPPIKQEEKRLAGDLEDLKKQIEIEQIALTNTISPLAAQVLGLLRKNQLSAVDKAAVQKLGELWTSRMNYTGMQDWSVLLLLQELNSGKIEEKGKRELFEKLYPLTAKTEGVNTAWLKQKELEKAYWQKLQ